MFSTPFYQASQHAARPKPALFPNGVVFRKMVWTLSPGCGRTLDARCSWSPVLRGDRGLLRLDTLFHRRGLGFRLFAPFPLIDGARYLTQSIASLRIVAHGGGVDASSALEPVRHGHGVQGLLDRNRATERKQRDGQSIYERCHDPSQK